MSIQYIDLNPERNWTFSTCVVAGDFVYASHTVGMTDDQGVRLESVEAQTEQTFRNLGRTLASAGASIEDIVQTTVYLRTLDDFNAMREAYRQQFKPGAYPSRMTATSDFLDAHCKVMIVAVAYKPRV
jgi:2-iminobutanoate/2-iminopropanoate deaminase